MHTLKEDITLSNGTIIVHKRLDNGAIDASVKGSDRAMSHGEYAEYIRVAMDHLSTTVQ